MNEQIKVSELYALCAEQMRIGNGRKMVCVSNDNGGNGFHGLFFGFTPVKGDGYNYSKMISDSKSIKDCDVIILG